MSNIKTKQPFQLPAQQQARVGQTWVERKAFLARGGGEAAPARQTPQKHVDRFMRDGRRPETVSQFDPRALFQKAKMTFSRSVPHRPSAVDHLHNGTAPLKTARMSRQWTDKENLRLLNLVIENPVYANKRSIQKARQSAATNAARNPVAPAAPQNAPTAQQYAQALARRGRTSR